MIYSIIAKLLLDRWVPFLYPCCFKGYPLQPRVLHVPVWRFLIWKSMFICFLQSYFRSVRVEKLSTCWGSCWLWLVQTAVWWDNTRRWLFFLCRYRPMPLWFLCYAIDSFTLSQAKNERFLVPYRMWELFLYETKRFNKRWLPLLLWIVKSKRIIFLVIRL